MLFHGGEVHSNENCCSLPSILPEDTNNELGREVVEPPHKTGNVRESRFCSLGENQFAFRHLQFEEEEGDILYTGGN